MHVLIDKQLKKLLDRNGTRVAEIIRFPFKKITKGLYLYQHIETDETVKKPDHLKMTVSSEEEREAISQLQEAINSSFITPGLLKLIHIHSYTTAV